MPHKNNPTKNAVLTLPELIVEITNFLSDPAFLSWITVNKTFYEVSKPQLKVLRKKMARDVYTCLQGFDVTTWENSRRTIRIKGLPWQYFTLPPLGRIDALRPPYSLYHCIVYGDSCLLGLSRRFLNAVNNKAFVHFWSLYAFILMTVIAVYLIPRIFNHAFNDGCEMQYQYQYEVAVQCANTTASSATCQYLQNNPDFMQGCGSISNHTILLNLCHEIEELCNKYKLSGLQIDRFGALKFICILYKYYEFPWKTCSHSLLHAAFLAVLITLPILSARLAYEQISDFHQFGSSISRQNLRKLTAFFQEAEGHIAAYEREKQSNMTPEN